MAEESSREDADTLLIGTQGDNDWGRGTRFYVDDDDIDNIFSVSSDTEDEAEKIRKYADGSDDFCPAGEQSADFIKWARYYRQIRESEGFDIVDYPGRCIAANFVPQPNGVDDPEFIGMATLALECSDVGEGYKLHKLVSVNAKLDYGVNYHITFEAKKLEAATDAVKTFQALVNDAETRTVKFCRIKQPRSSDISEA